MTKSFNQIKDAFIRNAKISGAKTNNPVVVAMVGVTGAGNSTVARALKKLTGWDVVEKNKIRVMLREKGRGFTPQTTDQIYYAVLAKILKGGGNAILDSDFAEKSKRRKLERFARRFRARVLYLHLACDRDVMLERILRARYNPETDIFKSAVVALREHSRRLLWHYRWSEANGGTLSPKRFPVKFFAEIDTTRPAVWKKKIGLVAKRLKKL
ncbi:MAG: AAA family ATPase [Candidatus Sungiibacteriota bacterium]